MTPSQERIAAVLRDRSPEYVSAYELRDRCAPFSVVDTIRNQIMKMRRRGAKISSRRGPPGGYSWDVSI